MKPNLKFNRIEHKGNHHYVKNSNAGQWLRDHEYEGLIKCKLVHNTHYTLIVPDQVYIKFGADLFWVQPLFFLANLIQFFEDSGECNIPIDISHGANILATFSATDLDRRFGDGSLVYRCKIRGPAKLFQFATGRAFMGKHFLYIELFHHTNSTARKSIEISAEFRASSWNIQGNKKLTNIHYLYLTPLPKIACDNDLFEIAMSTHGRIELRLDQNVTNHPDETLDVYRESTKNRTETIRCWVRSDQLSPQHMYRHTSVDGLVYYEVVSPFTHRIGVEPETNISIQKKTNTLTPVSPKSLTYVVLGDATTRAGLRAPYDEEHTDEILKIDNLLCDTEFIRYWRKNANSDLYGKKEVELAKFLSGNV